MSMPLRAVVLGITVLLITGTVRAQGFGQYPPFTQWYQNPLGIAPLKMHTANAILLPAAAAVIGILLTRKDTSLKNRISYYQDAGASYGYYGSYTSVYQANTGFMFQVRTWLAVGAEYGTYFFADEKNNSWGFSVRPVFRFFMVNRPAYKFYFESGAGILFTTQAFPEASGFFGDNRTGTQTNGTPKYGLGAEVKLSKTVGVLAGIRHVHVSNGNTFGEDRNPGHDSNGFYVGISYRPVRPQ